MAQFRYTAVGAGGDVEPAGILEAASEADAVAKLRRQGSLPISAEPVAEGLLGGLFHADFLPRGRLSSQQITDLTRELATMLNAGQDLDRALRYAQETAPSTRVQRVLTRISRPGARLRSALGCAVQGAWQLISSVCRVMYAPARRAGQLAEALARLAYLLERQRRVAAAVTSALIYPCLAPARRRLAPSSCC